MGRKLGIPEGAEFMTLDDFFVEKVERKKEKKRSAQDSNP